MRVLHAYCLNYNLGDYALGIGLKNLLRRYLEIELIAETNLQGTVFNEYFINEVVNKKYDLLVIGGGGIIHGSHWPNGWFWLIERELIKTIGIPFVVYGVGYNYFRGEGDIPERGVQHLKETIKHAAYFSVRNDESYERLREQTGIEAHEIPDPGFHVNLGSSLISRTLDEPYVLIQLANDKSEYRFGSDERKTKFIESMRTVIRGLAQTYKVVLSPHVYEDIRISREVTDGISNTEVWKFSEYAFDHPQDAMNLYKHAFFVLAMRGHGQIVPIGFGTPVISLENHPKNLGLMRKLNLLDYSVDIFADNFVDLLKEMIGRIEKNRVQLVTHYERINEKLMKDTSNAFKVIKAAIRDRQ